MKEYSILNTFCPRPMLKGPKRSFVLVLGVESSSKIFANGRKNISKQTKNFHKQNVSQIEQNMLQKKTKNVRRNKQLKTSSYGKDNLFQEHYYIV